MVFILCIVDYNFLSDYFYFRIVQNRVLLVVIGVIMVLVIGITIYFATKKKS